jgi:hypothetical protein
MLWPFSRAQIAIDADWHIFPWHGPIETVE